MPSSTGLMSIRKVRVFAGMVGDTTAILTPTEVAKLLLVSPITVRQWAQKGMLPAQTTAGGHRRFLRSDVEQFARQRGMQLPDARTTVLVVDDDLQLNKYLVAVLQTQVDDLQVYSAFDGFAAGRMVAQHQPEIVVLDIMMPGMDGVEVCKAIKADPSTEHTRVVGMTGHYTDELEHRMLAAGAVVLLKKPFSTEDLFDNCGLVSLQPA